jgi:membrane-associated protein
MHSDLPDLIRKIGYLGIWAIIFAESGLLIGFFLPGDSLLFTAGFLASLPQSGLNIWVLTFGAFVCAVLGDNVGYVTGYRWGRRLFQKQDNWLFKQKNLEKTQDFYERYGNKTIVLARFTPIIRTFAPIVAGIGAMRYRTFMVYNLIGGFTWTLGITFLGYFLGRKLPAEQVDKYFLLIIAAIILISLLPSIWHIIQENNKKRN